MVLALRGCLSPIFETRSIFFSQLFPISSSFSALTNLMACCSCLLTSIFNSTPNFPACLCFRLSFSSYSFCNLFLVCSSSNLRFWSLLVSNSVLAFWRSCRGLSVSFFSTSNLWLISSSSNLNFFLSVA